MIETVDVVVAVKSREDENVWRKKAAKKLRVGVEEIRGVRLVKESIDARKAPVRFQLRLMVAVGEELPEEKEVRFEAVGGAAGRRPQ